MAFRGRRPSPKPRSRRPALILLPLLILSVVAAVTSAATSARTDKPAKALAARAYLDEITPLITDSTNQGAEVADTRTQAAGSLDRLTIDRRLERVSRDTAATLAAVRALSPPASLRTANDLLVAALAIRAETAKSLRAALGEQLSAGSTDAAIGSLILIGRDMAAGDQAYELFRAGVPADVTAEGKTPGTPVALSDSSWLPDETTWSQPVLTVFVATLRNRASSAAIHDLIVLLVSTEPVPIGADGNAQVLPGATTLRVQIVVANIGNQPEKRLTVTATVSPGARANGQPDTARDFVDLAPGQRTTVALGGLALPAVGTPFTLTVKIDGAPGEANVTDNEKIATFVVH